MTEGTHLPGLEGNNPLGFLAALGVQEALHIQDLDVRLWWTNELIPTDVVDVPLDRLVECISTALQGWSKHRSLNPHISSKDSSAKFSPPDIRQYLKVTQDQKIGSSLATALISEASIDNKGVAKPSDLYFTAGRLLFVKIARTLLASLDEDDIESALLGPWKERSTSSLGWDTSYIPYSRAPTKPGAGDKSAYPGPEALAVLGMSRHPVFTGNKRTLTQGCSGTWQHTLYTWPIWHHPSGYGTVRSLLAQARHPEIDERHSRLYKGWGILLICQSEISRNRGQGGGMFGPPRILWSDY